MNTWVHEQLKTRKNFQSVEQEVFLSILHTADGLGAELAQALKAEKLTNAAYNALRIIRGAGRSGLPCSTISIRMLNRDSDITRLVDRLARRGLVSRERQEDDRRVVKVTITRAGSALLRKFDKPVLELHARQLGHLGRKRLLELARLLADARERSSR